MGKVKKDVGKPTAIYPSLDAIAESQRAEWRISYYERHATLAADQVAGLSKWLTASLFAANSGGIITLLNQADKIELPLWAGGSFITGLILALLSATANQEFYNRVSDPLLNMIAYWQEVRITGISDSVQHEQISDQLSSSYRWTWVGPTLGWLSGFAFIGGTIFTAVGLS